MATKTDPEKIRQISLRITAKRRGLNLQRSRKTGQWWIVRDSARPDGGYVREIVAGGDDGMSFDEIERIIRPDAAMAS